MKRKRKHCIYTSRKTIVDITVGGGLVTGIRKILNMTLFKRNPPPSPRIRDGGFCRVGLGPGGGKEMGVLDLIENYT